jgi:hypothetical protein
MQAFRRLSPDIVKSIQQRWLFGHWKRLRNGCVLPMASAFDLAQAETCRDDLSVLDVLPHNGAHRFLIVDHGKNVGSMFASSCAGKFLDETLPDAARARTLETYEHVVATGLPVYTVSHMIDAADRPILYERLLLPFGDANGKVVRILALLETISSEGTIERKSLLSNPQTTHQYQIKAELHVG